jgi:endoglucanase
VLVLLHAAVGTRSVSAQSTSGFELLGRGINYGNMLESPREGDWGTRYRDDYPQLVKSAGFDSVRIPVRWSSRTSATPPWSIEPAFLRRVEQVVNQSLASGLKVVLNVHHFDELHANPAGERDRFLAIWRQVATHFRGADERLFFELLNEPHDQLTAEHWNPLLAEALQEVRRLHPTRWVIIGPDEWNGIDRLAQLQLPPDDRRLIVTVHYYLPFPFTHQGASWVDSSPPVGTTWTGTPDERAEMRQHFQAAQNWARTHDRPLYVGEFGAYSRADMPSRAQWTRHVRTECEQSRFGWAYWELSSGFGAFDPEANQWRGELLGALLDRAAP